MIKITERVYKTLKRSINENNIKNVSVSATEICKTEHHNRE